MKHLVLLTLLLSASAQAQPPHESYRQKAVRLWVEANENLNAKLERGEDHEICAALYRVGAVARYYGKQTAYQVVCGQIEKRQCN
jgi:predicted component of type VI protein secretion system